MKRILYILMVLIVSLLLVGGMLILVLRDTHVQTALVQVVTTELGRGLKAHVSVGKVEYRFPARLRLKEVYMEDQKGDTLLYADELYARFHPFALRNNKVRFSRVSLNGVRLHGYQLENGEYNFDFLSHAFASNDTTQTPFTLNFQADAIEVEDAVVRLDNYTARLTSADIRLDNLGPRDIRATVTHFIGTLDKDADRLTIEDFNLRFILNDTLLALPTLYLRMPESELDASGIRITYPGISQNGIRDIITHKADSVRFRLRINKAKLTPNDLQLLVKDMGRLDGVVEMAAELDGYMDSINATNLALYYNGERLVAGDVAVRGLPDWRHATLRANLRDFKVNAPMLQDFISDWLDKPYHLPKEVWRLGDVHYRGLLSGDLSNLQWKGAFTTALGAITTDVTVQVDSLSPDIRFRGRIATRRFRLGRMLGNKEIGNLTFTVLADGALRAEGLFAKVDAVIKEFCYRDYCYSDLKMKGRITRHSYEGTLEIDDENLNMRFDGLANLSYKDAEMDFRLALNRFCPGALNLSNKYTDSELRLQMRAHSVGLNPDSLTGYLTIDSLYFRNDSSRVNIDELELVMESERKKKLLRLVSDVMTMRIQGDYTYATLLTTFKKLGVKYLPNLFSDAQRNKILSDPSSNQLDFYLYGHQLHELQHVLDLPYVLGDYPILKGYINERLGLFGLSGYAPFITNRQEVVREVNLQADNYTGPVGIKLSAQWYNSLYIMNTRVDKNVINVDFSSLDSLRERTSFLALDATIGQKKQKPIFDLHLQPSELQFADSTYRLADSHIRYTIADTLLEVEHFRIGTDHMFVEADGRGSTAMTDSLKLQLGHLRLGYILPFVLAEESFYADGDLTGTATVYGMFSQPMFDAVVRLDSAYLNEMPVGDVDARVELDREKMEIIIGADVINGPRRVAHLDGLVQPKENKWGLDIYPDSIPIAFINHWTEGILSDINGTASGRVQVLGDGPITYVLARVKTHDAHLTIPFTGCTYYVNDSVFMDSTAIRFPNMDIRDEEGNLLRLDGVLNHFNFKNFNFRIDGELHHTMAINLPDKAGELIQGKVYADGDIHIKGDDDAVVLSANATTVGKSRFRMSVAGASSAADNDFITFYDHNIIENKKQTNLDIERSFIQKKKILHGPKTKFMMGMNLDINPELLFQLVINDRTGDMLQGRGDGALRFTMDDSTGNIRLLGTYTLQSGTFGFTVGNLVRRDFTLGEGSQVIWNGRPETPELNVTAKYRVTANLKDLFGDQISDLTIGRSSVPVNTCVSLIGSLEEPTIRFGIELPQSDQAIESQVRSMINTEEMMMRQVVYLLVFGRFFTPEYLRNTSYTPLNETYSLLSSTVTGQINSWLGKLTNVFTMGFNYRSDGSNANASQEYEAVFQLQPVDRLIINGNIGYRYNDISNRPIFGDLDVEYMITPNGKVRIKAYTHTVDKYSLKQANTQQGVGFVFKHDFNWRKDKE